MPCDPQNEVISDWSALACLVADTTQPQDVRDQALQRLLPVIERLARQVAAKFRGSLLDDLVAESKSLVWSKIQQFDPQRGRFEDWCRTVLNHWAIDRWRRISMCPVQPAAGGQEAHPALTAAASDDHEDASEQVMKLRTELREVLNRIAWPPSRAVDYFAVLLLQLRLAAVRCLSQEPLSHDPAWRADLAGLVEWLLPWAPDERSRCLKPDWPSLGELWVTISQRISDPTVKIEADLICRGAASLPPHTTRLTPDVWNQWVHRAKDQARKQVQDAAVWARCFHRLLPDHPRRPRS